jgi:DNA replication protein DnaC
MTPSDLTRLDTQLQRLQLHHIQSHYQALATKAAEQQHSHLDYLTQLVEGEATMRENRSIERRIKNARFPVLKSLDDFQWSWPKKINRPQIQNLFRLAFIATKTNIVLIGNVGIGKTHLSIALGHAACLNGHSVLFTTAVDIINTLAVAQSAGQLKREFHRYLTLPPGPLPRLDASAVMSERLTIFQKALRLAYRVAYFLIYAYRFPRRPHTHGSN